VALGKTSRFAHLSKILVPVGTTVRKGMIIAITGMTQTKQPHLHWEVLLNSSRSPVNPGISGIDFRNIVNSR